MKVVAELSIKIMAKSMELVSLLCLNKFQEELALGFLYNEGVIKSWEDVKTIDNNDKMLAVVIELREGVVIDRRESLRSITSGCGKCYTYINPLKQELYIANENYSAFSTESILNIMQEFIEQAELYNKIGGVHSILFYSEKLKIQYGFHQWAA